ncbi:uncharacterized protein LOC132700911 [Cylas formicarius]|uniref:uncharacterized protein LOC132700911 n=1 Tax=Cylas formicarius TaxID=197179 RepID=UPI00295846C0|nr:uncharacterized protein LOC132700911 [Cylas formicarius]
MLACNCLNISIQLGSDIEKVTKESLALSEEEKGDIFFKQNVFYKSRLISVDKKYSGLVNTRKIGFWIINHCLNCDIHTHAVHLEKGAGLVLMYPKLLDAEAVKNIRLGDSFSTVFQIVVNPIELGPDNPPFEAYRNRDLDNIVKSLNELVTNYVKNEESAVEERIRKFASEQYQALNIAKERVEKEREALVNILVTAVRGTNGNENEQPIMSPKSIMRSSSKTSTSNKFSGPASPAVAPLSPKRQKNNPAIKPKGPEDDLIFEFEADEFTNYSKSGMSFDGANSDESEDEDGNINTVEGSDLQGISIRQQKQPGQTIAKSCPVDIPNFGLNTRIKTQYEASEDSDFSPGEQQIDIAASIKALANSVHGDSIFGELPRPRFSTQI